MQTHSTQKHMHKSVLVFERPLLTAGRPITICVPLNTYRQNRPDSPIKMEKSIITSVRRSLHTTLIHVGVIEVDVASRNTESIRSISLMLCIIA